MDQESLFFEIFQCRTSHDLTAQGVMHTHSLRSKLNDALAHASVLSILSALDDP